ncbi:MAG: hypothetical protein CL602_01375 [Alteromonas sp.]|uniref:hypothetical protein n=1 Tax=Alteromonas australica TaxID=589873 RepID=UPI000C55CE3C|nr:hypothetical protein [Alteromonas australica]MBU32545.1 hypothetical protein [Alteromonas sp.]|tara:strand:- start:975 stop:1484 length:510 start_codon:yes stop_codon:yes gene_type:complete
MLQSDLFFSTDAETSRTQLPDTLTDSLFDQHVFTSQVGNAQRQCRQWMRVRVYRNLNKAEFFSILALEGECKGKVIGYAKSVLIENGQYRVSEAGRQRVLRERRKCVHAYIDGVIADASNTVQTLKGNETYVTYNPYHQGAFFRPDSLEAQHGGFVHAVIQQAGAYIRA